MPGLLAGQPSSKLYVALPKGRDRWSVWEHHGTPFLVKDPEMICNIREHKLSNSQSYFHFVALHLCHCSFDSYLQSKAMFFLGIGCLEMQTKHSNTIACAFTDLKTEIK